MSRPFQIRRADGEDADAVLACLANAFEPYRNRYTPAAFADTVPDAETIHRRMSEMCVFVAVCGDKIAGTVGCGAHGKEGRLRGMAVVSCWQGADVAAALLEAAEAELKKNGCTHAVLETTEPLTRAIRFYEKHGFAPSGRVADFYGMQLYEYRKALSNLP